MNGEDNQIVKTCGDLFFNKGVETLFMIKETCSNAWDQKLLIVVWIETNELDQHLVYVGVLSQLFLFVGEFPHMIFVG